MSGELVGLVNEHGPRDHSAWAVLAVIAERLHGPMRSYDATNDELGRLTRLSRSTVKRVVAALVDDGWIARRAGAHKGTASTYRLRLDRFPAEAVETLLSKGSTVNPSRESTGVHGEPLSRPKGSTVSPKGSMVNPHSVSVPTPSTARAADEQLPGVLTPVRTGPDDDVIRAALDTFAIPHPSRTLRAELAAALRRGWTASQLNAHLRAEVDVRNCRDVVAVLVGLLRQLPPYVATVAPPADPDAPTCRECGLPEPECRRRERVSGHTWTPPVDVEPTTLGAELADEVAEELTSPTRTTADLLAEQRARSRAASGALRRRA